MKRIQDFKMSHGGSRSGAGRKPGATTKLNEAARAKAAEGGLLPLDYMLAMLRDETLGHADRFEAAKAAAPYVHAKLASVEQKTTHEAGDSIRDLMDAVNGQTRAK